MLAQRGLFIPFEGPDGSGKSTQIKLLRAELEKRNHPVVQTREIGGTPEAETIRDLVVRKSGGDWPPLAQMLLISTARYMHTTQLIQPALARGSHVLSDRYADSTYVYQVAAGGVDPGAYAMLYQLTLDGFEPDLTIMLDIDPEVGVRRAIANVNGNVSASEKADDRFEAQGVAFQQKVRAAYLDIAHKNPGRCVVIDASRSVDEVAADVWKTVEQKLAKSMQQAI